MADLDPLIRFRKYGVDEKQRLLAQLYREAEEMESQKTLIEHQMAKETQIAEELGDTESLLALNAYMDGARRRVKAIAAARQKLDVRIALAQEDMRAAFAEMKKIEMVAESRANEEEAALNAKETQAFSEIALDQYRRALEEEE